VFCWTRESVTKDLSQFFSGSSDDSNGLCPPFSVSAIVSYSFLYVSSWFSLWPEWQIGERVHLTGRGDIIEKKVARTEVSVEWEETLQQIQSERYIHISSWIISTKSSVSWRRNTVDFPTVSRRYTLFSSHWKDDRREWFSVIDSRSSSGEAFIRVTPKPRSQMCLFLPLPFWEVLKEHPTSRMNFLFDNDFESSHLLRFDHSIERILSFSSYFDWYSMSIVRCTRIKSY
jgi:hypothetical protein